MYPKDKTSASKIIGRFLFLMALDGNVWIIDILFYLFLNYNKSIQHSKLINDHIPIT